MFSWGSVVCVKHPSKTHSEMSEREGIRRSLRKHFVFLEEGSWQLKGTAGHTPLSDSLWVRSNDSGPRL